MGVYTMLQSLIIMFRETLEAALVVGVVLGYLKKTDQWNLRRLVYLGILAGVAASIVGAIIFNTVAGGFSGRGEEIFEGFTMLVGAALLTTMILWMMKQSNVSLGIEERVAAQTVRSRRYGLFSLIFVSVLREGIESVIFLGAARFVSADHNLLGALLGIVTAVVLAYLFFVGSLRLNLKNFFAVTNIVLILFAAGLVGHGLHELQEAGLVPVLVEHVWDLNPEVLSQERYPPLHESGILGSIAKGLFGYNGNPSLLETVFYGLYLTGVGLTWRMTSRMRSRSSRQLA